MESRGWNDETMQSGGLRLPGIVFSSFLEAVSLPLSNLCRPHGTRLAIGQKIISTGHELEISSWGMDPISNQGGGKEISRLFLVAQTAFVGGFVKSSYPEKIRLFKNEIKVVGSFFSPFKLVNVGVFCAVLAVEGGAGCVCCAVTTQACSSAGAVTLDGLIQMDDICKKYAQVKNSQRSCSGQVFNFSFLRRIKLFC